MSKKFAEYSKLDLSNVNKEVLKKWQDGDIFHKSLEIREGHPSFVFYEGPPSANGMPGIHHVIARSIKDIFCRYKTMKGYLVNRKAGWDTHGLPVELGVEKTLGITKEDIGKKISVAEYNAACRRDVMKFTKEWTDLTQKMGYWVDLENPYITYDNRYIETLWYLLKELYKKGLLYKGYTIQPYSPAAGTGLSSHELNQPGCYRDVKDTTCTAQFRILDPKPEMAGFGEPFFLAWTTTPWTLPSNTALCVGPNFTYVAVQTYNPYTGMPMTAVLAKDLLNVYFNPKAADLALTDYKLGDKLVPFKVVGEWKGPELAGMHYEQLIPWVNPGEGAFRVITGDYVTVEDGTGIVHIAPTFGADDDRVAKASGVPPLMMIDKDGNRRPMVDMTGKFYLLEDLDPEYVQEHMNAADYDPWQGKFVKNAYDATKGEVLVDGVNVKEYTQKALRNKIGYVSQKAVLFTGSIKSNVAYGDNGTKGFTDDVVKQAIETAQAKEFVDKTEGGVDAFVAQGGSNFSGGQKQRLSIARAICRHPEILIFDDSFSALDYKTDRVLRDTLRKTCADATRFIVAQRIGTIRDADKIIVLDDGKIAGMGKHNELMETCEVYRQIAYSQLSKEELA